MDYVVWSQDVLWDQVELLGTNIGNIFNICILGFFAVCGVCFIASLVRSLF